MIIGVPKEIKQDEYRVGMVPAGVDKLRRHGHTVLVQKGAGIGSGITDREYAHAGATITAAAATLYRRADMIVKVKEPQIKEYPFLRKGLIVFTYFHFAASKPLTLAMMKAGITGVAYETIQLSTGELPLLTPMSEVAGRMSIQEGAKYLERPMEGRGVLLGGVPGVAPAEVMILGGGVVGTNAAKIAAGMGARVTLLEVNVNRMRYLDDVLPKNVRLLMSDSLNIRECLHTADLVIGAVLITGALAPVLVRREQLKHMKYHAVMVDVAIDQGGCFETSRPTTHSKPIYMVDNVLHYCVTNMPGAVSRTSTFALTNVTLPYVLEIAEKGVLAAAEEHPAIRKGINVLDGAVTNQAVAETFGLECRDI